MPGGFVFFNMVENIEFWAKFEGKTRKCTQIRIDKDTSLLGSIIMLNPGKSAPIKPEERDDQGFLKCEPDSTMQEIEIIISDYSKRHKGFIRIVNLSDLRNPNFRNFMSGKPKFKKLNEIAQEIRGSQWVWLAWTCDSKYTELEEKKKEVFQFFMSNNKFKIIGKKKSKYGYY